MTRDDFPRWTNSAVVRQRWRVWREAWFYRTPVAPVAPGGWCEWWDWCHVGDHP